MPVTISRSEVNQAGWQKHREHFPEFKGCDVGKALEAFKAYYLKDSAALLKDDAWKDALKKGQEVSAALRKAKDKANAITDATRKKSGLELVAGYDKIVAEFAKHIQDVQKMAGELRRKALETAEKARAEFRKGLTLKATLTTPEILPIFQQHTKEILCAEILDAYVGWLKHDYKRVAEKYGKDNDWNILHSTSKALYDHYTGTKAMDGSALQAAQEDVTNQLYGMLNASPLTQFRTSKLLDPYLAKKFPV
jgi:hypothetical protein